MTSSPDDPSPFDKGSSTSRRNNFARLAGIAIGAVGLGFAVFILIRSWDEILAAEFAPRTLALAGIVGMSGMATIGLNWIRIIRFTGGTTRVRHGLQWYFVGQLGKYIPGGLWAVLGRGELATRGGVDRTVSYTTVGVSLVTTYAAAATTGAVFIAFGSSTTTARSWWIALSIATVVAGTFGLSDPVVRRVNALTSRIGIDASLPSTTPRMSLSAMVLTIPAWIAIGGATALVGAALGFSIDSNQVISATSYSWLAGFLVIPVPGGLGVREAAFVALYPGTTEEAAAIAISARIVFVLVDITGAAASTLAARLGGQLRA